MPRYASSAQLRAARSLLGWTRAELAEKMGVARQTIDKLENQSDARQIAMRQRLQQKFEENGVLFQDEDSLVGEGVRFKHPRSNLASKEVSSAPAANAPSE